MAVRFFNMPKSSHEQMAAPSPGIKEQASGSSYSSTMKESGANRPTTAPLNPIQKNGTETPPPPTASSQASTKADGITFANQDSLPRLPIPDLESTCKKYLETLAPLQTGREHEETKGAVKEFLRSGGPELQEKLKKYATSKSSYIEQFCEF